MTFNYPDVQVMKCLAKGLVKGQIDQVAGTVDLDWVQPRVLDKEQLKTIQVKNSKAFLRTGLPLARTR